MICPPVRESVLYKTSAHQGLLKFPVGRALEAVVGEGSVCSPGLLRENYAVNCARNNELSLTERAACRRPDERMDGSRCRSPVLCGNLPPARSSEQPVITRSSCGSGVQAQLGRVLCSGPHQWEPRCGRSSGLALAQVWAGLGPHLSPGVGGAGVSPGGPRLQKFFQAVGRLVSLWLEDTRQLLLQGPQESLSRCGC